MEAVREPKKSMDSILLFLVLLLVVWGLIFLYSTSAYNGRGKFHDPAYYFKKQLFATSLGLIAMYLVSCIDYHIAVKFAPLFYLASMGLSLAVLLFGQEYNGSKRWLSIGPFSFQPSEFAKAAVILFLTFLITNSQKKKDGIFWMAGIMLPLLPIVGLVGTNNLSTAIIILGIGVILVFISHPRYLPFIGIGVAGTVFIAIFLGARSAKRHDFFNYLRRDRSVWCSAADNVVCTSNLEIDGNCNPCRGFRRSIDFGRNYGAYRNSGYFKYCGCDKYNSKYRNYPALCQLWRDFCCIFTGRDGNGACSQPERKEGEQVAF